MDNVDNQLTPEEIANGLTLEDRARCSAFYEGVAVGKVRKAGGSEQDIQRVREEYRRRRQQLAADQEPSKPHLFLI